LDDRLMVGQHHGRIVSGTEPHWMYYRSGKRRHSLRPPGRRGFGGGGRDEAPSGVAILVFFTILAVACVGGYFLLMKLIDISRQEDCLMAARTNCLPPIELPSNRLTVPRQNPGL
jgi:hypothetical protein